MVRYKKMIEPSAFIRSDFPETFGIPRQSGLARTQAEIVFAPDYQNPDAVRGLEDFSHIWLIWGFSANEKTPSADHSSKSTAVQDRNNVIADVQDSRNVSSAETRKSAMTWKATVRPPRLGGNTRIGVFASRSPFRPNGLGLSSVRLLRVEMRENGPVLTVEGADLMDGTPIYDIKPYIPYADAHPGAVGDFTDSVPRKTLTVDCPAALLSNIPVNKQEGLLDLLSQDPRPSYQHDPERIYGLSYAGYSVKFTVAEEILTVREIFPLTNQ